MNKGNKFHFSQGSRININQWLILMALFIKTSAHLGFFEGRGPNFRTGANQYETKKKRI